MRFRARYFAALSGLTILAAACETSKIATGPDSNAPGNPGTHRGWYVSPAGTAGGDGTTGRPWDLQLALTGANGKVQPGDTIWLRGGTYSGTFISSLSGTAAASIVVRQYPGERATIDGGSASQDALVVDGQFAIYWGFEIMQSGTARSGVAGTGSGVRPDGVYVRNASNVKLINLIVHDVGHGVYTENTAHNIEIYGWVIYNGGYEDGARSDGHGIYIKNDGNGWKIARDNVIFNQFGFGIHGYTEATGQLKNIVLDGNVLFNNGTVSSFSDNPNLQLGGLSAADNDSVTNNMLYYSAGSGLINAKIGYKTLVNGSTVFAGNYLVGASQTLDVGYWQNLSVQGNTLQSTNMIVAQHDGNAPSTERWNGNSHVHDPVTAAWQLGLPAIFATWQAAAGASDQATAASPGAPKVFVRRNRYEAGRATIVIYNWTQQGAVGVDVSGVLTVGTHYVVHNVQDMFGAPVTSGTYGGGSIIVPMTGVTPAQVIGGSPHAAIRTGPYFDAFVVTSG